jgi:SP family arabinose:H+ symporter-like MFS transporter
MDPQLNFKYIIRLTLAAGLGGLLFGFDVAIITGAVPFIQDYFQLNEIMLGWGVSALLFGAIAGAAVAGKLADAYGRKKILKWVAVIFALSSLATGLATEFWVFILWRIVGGLAVGAASVVSPMYIAEVSPYKIRGRLVSIYQLSIVTGILLSYLINYLLHDIDNVGWRLMFISGALPAVVFFILLFFIPETPRFLHKTGYGDLAYQVLKKISGQQNADEEMKTIAETHVTKEADFKALLKPRYSKMIFVGFGLAVFVQLCGINTIIDYAPIILQTAGWKIDTALFSTFIIGAVNLTFTFVSIWAIDRFGRKLLYMIGSAGMALVLLAIAVLSIFQAFTGVLALVLILLFIALFASCIGPVFWTLVSEIFPTHIRGMAMSVPVFTQWIFNALVVLFFPWMLVNAGSAITFGLLSFCSFLMLVFTIMYVPETKGKTLEEIQEFWHK